MEQRYPFSVNIYLNKERYFIDPHIYQENRCFSENPSTGQDTN